MKLIIQIPCYNEEQTLGVSLDALPREVPGIDVVEWLIINDGSTDGTVDVARAHGVDHIVDLQFNQGLAKAYMAGLDACIRYGADIIVNTDADNQYCADDIPKLVAPILDGEAELVIGERPISTIAHFSPLKKMLQKLGSWAVRKVSNTGVPDSPSGFRAIKRDVALRQNVFNPYTYTLETIIQAGHEGIRIASIPIRVNEDLRPSRLVKSIRSYIWRSTNTMTRIFMIYKPLRFFLILGSIPFLCGVVLGIRWFFLAYGGPKAANIPSLILSAVLVLVGFQLWMLGFVADLLSVNRKLLQENRLRIRKIELSQNPSAPEARALTEDA